MNSQTQVADTFTMPVALDTSQLVFARRRALASMNVDGPGQKHPFERLAAWIRAPYTSHALAHPGKTAAHP